MMSKGQISISSIEDAVRMAEAGAAAIVLAYEWLKQYPDDVSEEQCELLDAISAAIHAIAERRFRPPQ